MNTSWKCEHDSLRCENVESSRDINNFLKKRTARSAVLCLKALTSPCHPLSVVGMYNACPFDIGFSSKSQAHVCRWSRLPRRSIRGKPAERVDEYGTDELVLLVYREAGKIWIGDGDLRDFAGAGGADGFGNDEAAIVLWLNVGKLVQDEHVPSQMKDETHQRVDQSLPGCDGSRERNRLHEVILPTSSAKHKARIMRANLEANALVEEDLANTQTCGEERVV
jgi:hypothetical protein